EGRRLPLAIALQHRRGGGSQDGEVGPRRGRPEPPQAAQAGRAEHRGAGGGAREGEGGRERADHPVATVAARLWAARGGTSDKSLRVKGLGSRAPEISVYGIRVHPEKTANRSPRDLPGKQPSGILRGNAWSPFEPTAETPQPRGHRGRGGTRNLYSPGRRIGHRAGVRG